MDEPAMRFISTAFENIDPMKPIELSEQEKANLYQALCSLDPSRRGFTMDDFMRTLQSFALWNAKGRGQQETLENAQVNPEQSAMQI